MRGKPYKYAKLYDANGDVSVGKEWYFYFYILNPTTGKYKRYFERFDINRIRGRSDNETRKKRYDFAKEVIAEINSWLDSGEYKQSTEINSADKSLKSGIALAMELKRNKNLKLRSLQTYQNVADRFVRFLDESYKKDVALKDVNKQIVLSFRDYVLKQGDVSNFTANKVINLLRAVFTELVEREYLETNPCAGIKNLETVQGKKNEPFTMAEMEVIFKVLPKEHERLWMFFLFIWYGMMRPNEICQVTAGMIDFERGFLYLPATVSKTKINRVIYIPSEFKEYLISMGVKDLPPDKYLFSHSRTLASGDRPVVRNRISEKWKAIIKDKYNIQKDMYAAKHTSAELFKKQGGSVEALQTQMGHTTIQTTEIYLKKMMPEDSLQRFIDEFKGGPLAPNNPI